MFATLKAYAFQALSGVLILAVTSLGVAYWIKSSEAESLGKDNKVLISNNATLSGNVETLSTSVKTLNDSVVLLQTETKNNSELLKKKNDQDAKDKKAIATALAKLEEQANADPELRTRFDARVPDAVYDFLFAPVDQAGADGGQGTSPDPGPGPGRPPAEEGTDPAGEGRQPEGTR